jgi:hypothetical protein
MQGLGAGGKSPGSLKCRVNPFHCEGMTTYSITRSAERAICQTVLRLPQSESKDSDRQFICNILL